MAVAAFAYGVSTAQAADLGGNCCADLEERVAELEATTARKGNRKVSLTVSGHVNQAFLWHDLDEVDGDATGFNKYQIIDNENSQSRFRFRGEAQINADWSAGFLMEFGTAALQNDGGNISLRHNVVWIHSKQLGKFYIGRTSEATDGIVEISLSKASTASTLGTLAPFDSFLARQDLAPGIAGVTVNASLNNPFDGARKDLVKYVSPTVAGFSLSAAWSEDDSWDVALRYAGEFGQIRVAGGIGYRDESQSEGRDFWGGSASVMHTTSGLFVDGTYGESDGTQSIDLTISLNNTSISFDVPLAVESRAVLWGVRGGIEQKFNSLGKTTVFGEYQQVDVDAIDTEITVYGLGIVQQIDGAAMELYANWRNVDLNSPVLDQDANVITSGARIRF